MIDDMLDKVDLEQVVAIAGLLILLVVAGFIILADDEDWI